jgi:hypothetical protein
VDSAGNGPDQSQDVTPTAFFEVAAAVAELGHFDTDSPRIELLRGWVTVNVAHDGAPGSPASFRRPTHCWPGVLREMSDTWPKRSVDPLKHPAVRLVPTGTTWSIHHTKGRTNVAFE